ncbi:MAG: hypothetical protein IANPNBLG_00392 [Bryobacteraceae bacterium]|nr:hypothetical protein [Bryobacteraceae bacterium]
MLNESLLGKRGANQRFRGIEFDRGEGAQHRYIAHRHGVPEIGLVAVEEPDVAARLRRQADPLRLHVAHHADVVAVIGHRFRDAQMRRAVRRLRAVASAGVNEDRLAHQARGFEGTDLRHQTSVRGPGSMRRLLAPDHIAMPQHLPVIDSVDEALVQGKIQIGISFERDLRVQRTDVGIIIGIVPRDFGRAPQGPLLHQRVAQFG